jgi:hypothetical protein
MTACYSGIDIKSCPNEVQMSFKIRKNTLSKNC